MVVIGGNQFYIVDLSYIIFFSGYSAFTTYKRNFDIQNSSLHPKFDPTLDEEFCEIFQSTLSYTIKKPLQSINPFINLSNVIFVQIVLERIFGEESFIQIIKLIEM